MAMASVNATAAAAAPPQADVRFATFNASLNRPTEGLLTTHLSNPAVDDQFRRQAKFDAANVSVKSLVEANGAVAKGDAAFWFPPVAGAMAGIREGKLVPLAVTPAIPTSDVSAPTTKLPGRSIQSSAA